MNKIRVSFIFIAALFLISASGTVLAQEEPTAIAPEETIAISDLGVSEPKILPTSPFYFFKEISRGLQGLITFNPVAKAELELKFTNEKAAEIKKISETQPQNTQAVQKALENYQKSQENLRAKIEKLTETSQNPNVDKLLDNLTDKVVKHEKLFDEIAFKFKEKEGIAKAVSDAATGSENIIGEASKKDDAAKFASRLEKVLLEEKGGDLKNIRSVEIIDRLSDKTAPEIKNSLERLREEFSKKSEQDIQNFVDKKGENALKDALVSVPGNITAKSVILEEIQKRTEENLSQTIVKTMDQLRTSINEETNIGEKAKEQIRRAETMIQEVEKRISESAAAKISTVVSTLLTESKEHLENAKTDLEEEKYGEAFGQARSAEVLARNALKFLENDQPKTDNLERQIKELEEKINTYRNLISHRGLAPEQTENANEILNNNAVLQLGQARESLANGDLEQTKKYIEYIKKTILKLSNILERKTTSAVSETETAPTPVKTLPASPVQPVGRCEEIIKNVLGLKDSLASGRINESDFQAKYNLKTRELIVCQEQKNAAAPAPAPAQNACALDEECKSETMMKPAESNINR